MRSQTAKIDLKAAHGYKRGWSVANDLVGPAKLRSFDDWKTKTEALLQDSSGDGKSSHTKKRPKLIADSPSVIPTVIPSVPVPPPPQPPPPPAISLSVVRQPASISSRPTNQAPLRVSAPHPVQLPVKQPHVHLPSIIEWFDKYEPARLDHIVGNEKRFGELRGYLKNVSTQAFARPRVVLLSGPPGCGKSTGAQLILKELQLKTIDYDPFALNTTNEAVIKRHFFHTVQEAKWTSEKRQVLFCDHFDSKDARPLVSVLEKIITGRAQPASFKDTGNDQDEKKGGKKAKVKKTKLMTGKKKQNAKKHWIPSVVVCIVNDVKSAALRKLTQLSSQFASDVKKRQTKQRQRENKEETRQKEAQEQKTAIRPPSLKEQERLAEVKSHIEQELLQDELEQTTPRFLHVKFWPAYSNELQQLANRVIRDSKLQNLASHPEFWTHVKQLVSAANGDGCALMNSLRCLAYGILPTVTQQMDNVVDPFQLASKFLKFSKPKDKRLPWLNQAAELLDHCSKDHDIRHMILLLLFQNLLTFWPRVPDKMKASQDLEIKNTIKFKLTANSAPFAQLSPSEQEAQWKEWMSHDPNILQLSSYSPTGIAFQNYHQALLRVSSTNDAVKKKSFDTYMAAYENRRPINRQLLANQAHELHRLANISDELATIDHWERRLFERKGGEDADETFQIASELSHSSFAHVLRDVSFSTDHAQDRVLGGGNIRLDIREYTAQDRKIKTSQQWWQNLSRVGAKYWDDFDSSLPLNPWKNQAQTKSTFSAKSENVLLSSRECVERFGWSEFDRTKMAPDNKTFSKMKQAEQKAQASNKKEKRKRTKTQAAPKRKRQKTA